MVASVGAVYTARTFGLSRQGQVTERFTRAVDQVGRQELDVRIGGIYGLERIARDSPRDHQAVMEVLSAFVRNRPREASAQFPTFPADVQAALTVIGRRYRRNDPSEFRINFDGADLRHANLAQAHLASAMLSRTQLQGAILAEADLQEAWLIEAHLQGASLIGARMRQAKLGGAHLERAVLQEAQLQGADLTRATLDGALFGDSSLPGHPRSIMTRESAQARTQTVGAVPSRFGHHPGPANLQGADLEDARFTVATGWPPGFDPESRGERLEDRGYPSHR